MIGQEPVTIFPIVRCSAGVLQWLSLMWLHDEVHETYCVHVHCACDMTSLVLVLCKVSSVAAAVTTHVHGMSAAHALLICCRSCSSSMSCNRLASCIEVHQRSDVSCIIPVHGVLHAHAFVLFQACAFCFRQMCSACSFVARPGG